MLYVLFEHCPFVIQGTVLYKDIYLLKFGVAIVFTRIDYAKIKKSTITYETQNLKSKTKQRDKLEILEVLNENLNSPSLRIWKKIALKTLRTHPSLPFQ